MRSLKSFCHFKIETVNGLDANLLITPKDVYGFSAIFFIKQGFLTAAAILLSG